MPIIKSAIKRVRQQKVHRARNVATMTTVRKNVKLFRADVVAADLKKAQTDLAAAISDLDKAVKRGVLHKNTASRKKSQITREYNAVAANAYGTENPGKPSAKKAAKEPVAKKTTTTAKPAVKDSAKKAPAKKSATKKPSSK